MYKWRSPLHFPKDASDYIRKRFGDGCMTEFHCTRNDKGQILHYVEVGHDDTLFHLKFDDEGHLLRSSDEPLLEMYDEEPYDR